MKIKGNCTAIDYRTVSFVLDDKVTIFAALLFENREIKLPAAGDLVQIYHAKWIRRNEVYLRVNSTLTIQNKLPLVVDPIQSSEEDIEIGQLVTTLCFKYVFTYDDLDYLNQNIKRIKNINSFPLGEKLNEQFVHRISADYLVLKCVDVMLLSRPSVTTGFLIKIPYDYYEKSAVRKIHKFWQLTSYKTDLNECMIGLLHVYHYTGVLLLTDYNHSLSILILCKNPTKYSQKLQKILNKYVCIKNFSVFKEEYSKIRKYKYIVARIDDINVLADGLSPPQMIPEKNNAIVDVHVQYRSSIIRTNATKASCLTFCKLNFEDREHYWYLRLEGNHLDTYPMVNEHDVFRLRCSNEFVKRLKDFQKDMAYQVRTEKSIPCYILPSDSQLQFSENKELDGPMVWKTVEDIYAVIKDSSMAVYSFEAIIERKMVGPLRYLNPSTSVDFGIPASEIILQLINVPSVERIGYQEKLPVLVTYAEQIETYEKLENKKKTRISLILDQWDHKHYPIGLIPNMRIRLINWIPDADKIFLKSCPTSNIIPIDYPRIDFTSGNVDTDNWGDPWLLGYGMHVPIGMICWGQTETIFIRSLLFETDCGLCTESVLKGVCVACKNSNPQHIRLSGKILLYVKDCAGKCDVLSSELDVIRVLLDFDAYSDWVYISTCLKDVCPFDFKYLDACKMIDKTDNTKLKNGLIAHFKNINKTSTYEFDLKCRRIDKDRIRTTIDDSHIQWYCLEARATELPKSTARYGGKISRRV